jgi:beta-galactosidase
MKAVTLTFLLGLATPAAFAERVTVPLNGPWQIGDTVAAEPAPRAFPSTVAVPGLVHNATPAFPDVDAFDSLELVNNKISQKLLPESARVAAPGVSRQKRNYFWYRRTFATPARKGTATLRVRKAQFGTAVWLNGKKIGEYPGCFSAGYFDLTPAIRWQGENVLLVRVGAHPGVLPATYPAGTDFEKLKWTPGIYDDVDVLLADAPLVESVQVAPRVASSEILVETKLKNPSATPVTFELRQAVKAWRGGDGAEKADAMPVTLAAGESKAVRQTIKIEGAHLWSPEDPFLYFLDTSTGGGDSVRTRFGMREFRYDTATRRAYLNGRPYFLRGSNVTLHRFFEDPDSGALPWDEAWVRRLLVDLPKKLRWNAFRFCIGPVPEKWLDVADEAGLLIQNEFFVWTGDPAWAQWPNRSYDLPEMIRQYSDWMRDTWNHPSVAVWDANNETKDARFGEKIVPAVRALDLSNRNWENSYNQPVGPDDPVEDHPYLHASEVWGGPPFDMTMLEKGVGAAREPPIAAHAAIINEYGWLWVRRDGEPTVLTAKIYERLLGRDATRDERLELNAYLLAGKTEYWRAYRNYAGILHFVYLTCSYPGVFTADHFADVKALKLNPWFEDYMSEAMKPLGVYLNFFHPTLAAGKSRTYRVMMVNDLYGTEKGTLRLTFEAEDGREAARVDVPFEVAPLGTLTRDLDLSSPATPGRYLLKATAITDAGARTVSRRKVTIGQP